MKWLKTLFREKRARGGGPRGTLASDAPALLNHSL